MALNSKVYIRVCGKGFAVVSNQEPEYVKSIAEELDERIGQLLRANTKITYDQAAVLVCLNLCDELRQEKLKNEKSKDVSNMESMSKKLLASEETIMNLKKHIAIMEQKYRHSIEQLKLEHNLKEKEFLDMIEE